MEDFHGAVWRLPDGEMAIGGGSGRCIFSFFGWPCSNRNFILELTMGFVLCYKKKCLNQKDMNDLFSQDS